MIRHFEVHSHPEKLRTLHTCGPPDKSLSDHRLIWTILTDRTPCIS